MDLKVFDRFFYVFISLCLSFFFLSHRPLFSLHFLLLLLYMTWYGESSSWEKCQNYQRQINRFDVRSIVPINPTFISKLKLAKPFISCVYIVAEHKHTHTQNAVGMELADKLKIVVCFLFFSVGKLRKCYLYGVKMFIWTIELRPWLALFSKQIKW